MDILKEIAEYLVAGNEKKVSESINTALKDNIEPRLVMQDGLIAGMSVIGDRFKNNDIYLPDVLVAARAMNAGLAIVEPLLGEAGEEPLARAVSGTVKGDLHDIGKNIVVMMLRGAGFQVTDLGVDVAPEKFLEAASETGAQLVTLSSLLTLSMPTMEAALTAIRDSDLRDKVKVMVGGAPVTQRYADGVGADGYASDAATAVEKAKELLGL